MLSHSLARARSRFNNTNYLVDVVCVRELGSSVLILFYLIKKKKC